MTGVQTCALPIYLTSHDGFTLNDLVSYNGKHNEDNGEDNKDGGNNNWSYNHGHEGEGGGELVEAIRERQVKNLAATLLLSIGSPMLLGGDEFRRSQKGNNNAYCQDNHLSWYDFSLVERNATVLRFVSELVALRLRHPAFRRPEFFTGKDADYNAMPDIMWYDDKGRSPDWARIERMIAWRLDGSHADILADRDDNDFYVICNAWPEARRFIVHPAPYGKLWARAIDTALPSPLDIASPGTEAIISPQGSYLLEGRSLVLLMAKDS